MSDTIDLKSKGQYWTIILYPENMISNWKYEMPRILQFPICYIIHDKDLRKERQEERKTHMHLMIIANNTTTANSILSLIKLLSADSDKPCFAITTLQRVVNIRGLYDYFIHDTAECRAQRKHLYAASERIVANGFDIGVFEQFSFQDKISARDQLRNYILDNMITDYRELELAIKDHFKDQIYSEVSATCSAYFERIIKGNYLYLIKQASNINNPL